MRFALTGFILILSFSAFLAFTGARGPSGAC
jgi:hypothetical protein